MLSEIPEVASTGPAASRKEQHQRSKDVGMIEQARVILPSLEPVKARIGARWPHRRETVRDGVERALFKLVSNESIGRRTDLGSAAEGEPPGGAPR